MYLVSLLSEKSIKIIKEKKKIKISFVFFCRLEEYL